MLTFSAIQMRLPLMSPQLCNALLYSMAIVEHALARWSSHFEFNR
jgi:hypothetical protein